MMLESSQREVDAARRLEALEADLRKAEQSRPSPSNIRVKAEIEWPSYDGMDTYYDIDEFFRDLSRVMMLASGGRGYPPQERLEMLRGGLRGTPLLDYKTFVDHNDARLEILESGTKAERECLWKEGELYLRKHHHRPLLERQRRARSEYQACSMRDGGSPDFPSFLAEFRKCVKNLERASLQKPAQELKVDFLEGD